MHFNENVKLFPNLKEAATVRLSDVCYVWRLAALVSLVAVVCVSSSTRFLLFHFSSFQTVISWEEWDINVMLICMNRNNKAQVTSHNLKSEVSAGRDHIIDTSIVFPPGI